MGSNQVFVSYSHKDESWKNRLITQLNATQKHDVVPWDDSKIQIGSDWLSKIYHVIENSSVAILLISADFLASKFIKTHEIPRLLQKNISSGLYLIPLIVKPCPWKQIDWLSRMQVSPYEGKPLTSFSEHDADTCLSRIAEQIGNFTKKDKSSYLPRPGSMVTPSVPYTPPKFLGLKLENKDPFSFKFVLNLGDAPHNDHILYSEAEKLIEYFLTCLAIPEEDLWVNLSPLESERVLPDNLSRTKMGKDLLAQDYVLKQFNASLNYPEFNYGNLYWNFIYEKMLEVHGSTEKPVNTYNKVWIVPKRAKVSQFGGLALITDESLDVLVEEDYKFLKSKIKEELSNLPKCEVEGAASIGSTAFSKFLLSEIKKEVNDGCHFSTTKQIYYSLILARWYKQTIEDSLVSKCYVDKSKFSNGLEDSTSYSKDIFKQYVEAMEEGVFNYIREDHDPVSSEMIPRKYFSGGILASAIKERIEIARSDKNTQMKHLLGLNHKCYLVQVGLKPDIGSGNDPNGGSRGGDSVAGVDFSRVEIDLSKYGREFRFAFDEAAVKNLFSTNFSGFDFYIKNISLLESIDELIDE